MYVVVVFCPVVSDEQHHLASFASMWMNPFEPKGTRRRPNGSVLELARHPISATDDLTNQPGHDLALGIDHHSRTYTVLTGWRLGNQAPAQDLRSGKDTLIDCH
ncbi:MAG: hypothetical protein JWQ86_4613 [Mycobacterium sp.]|nr:hypothetical protein [Mycobacterium sp.]